MRSILPRTIQGQLILSHLLVSLISIALISIYAAGVLYQAGRAQVEKQYTDLGIAAANELVEPLRQYTADQVTLETLEALLHRRLDRYAELHYTLFQPSGNPLIDKSGVMPSTAEPEIRQALQNDSGKVSWIGTDAQGSRRLYLAVRLTDGEQALGILRLDVPLSLALDASRRSLGLLIATALVVALTMSGVGFFLARSIAEPIQNITLASERLAQGELGARVEAPTVPYELDRLAKTFNSMADRLQLLVSELRSFVANASHELRTPLTAIKLRVEALRSGALEDPPVSERFLAEIESEVDRLSKMVSDLLDLSRIESGLDTSKKTTLDLGGVVADVYETFSVRAERAGVEMKMEIQPDVPAVLGNEDQLRRMLYNLVDNAIKYTHRGGQVILGLQTGQTPDTLLLTVKDTGFGIAAAQLPHVFERFYRVEATRPRYGPSQGSGLGLSISKSIAEAHGGKIGVESQVGKGSTFWVELPAHKIS